MSAEVGIIIVNYNTYEETIMCVESVKKYTTCSYTIYIVDNGSKRNIANSLAERFYNEDFVTVILLDKNLGYSAGNNIGIKKAEEDGCQYILVLNSDVEFKNDVIEKLIRQLEGDAVIAGPKIVNLDGKDGQQLIKTYTIMSAFLDRMPFVYIKRYFNLYRLDATKIHSGLNYYGMVQGSCFLTKTDAFKSMDYFDENVFLYSEERIISIKMKERNYLTCYCPDALIIHKEGRSTQKTGNAFADYHRYASDYYTIFYYCKGPQLFKKIIKKMRLFSFFCKTKKDSSYSNYYVMLKRKLKQIEELDYKILFNN